MGSRFMPTKRDKIMKEIDNEVKGVGKIEFFRILYKVNVGILP